MQFVGNILNHARWTHWKKVQFIETAKLKENSSLI